MGRKVISAFLLILLVSFAGCRKESKKFPYPLFDEDSTEIVEKAEAGDSSIRTDIIGEGEFQAPAAGETSLTSETSVTTRPGRQYDSSVPLGVQALLDSYPDNIKGYEEGYLIFADGSKLLYDDGREKGFEDMLDNSSPKDMFYVAYKLPNGGSPEYLVDAGRSRSEDLFKKMYGRSKGEVSGKLVQVQWFGTSVPFTSVNGAAKQLAKAAEELAQHPELRKYLKSSGTFYWRNVRGAKRLSAHSYGIAFDIGVDNSDYWLWKNPNASETAKISYHNRFPRQIAEIFQKYGFIWGGSWYHFDTMHFEYRPEILRYAELASQSR